VLNQAVAPDDVSACHVSPVSEWDYAADRRSLAHCVGETRAFHLYGVNISANGRTNRESDLCTHYWVASVEPNDSASHTTNDTADS
jgi:protein tyrosine phosphatase (PTP) superfamily phosphohydrolase (DUF442 family)